MNGNICRCATYLRIREAIHRAAGDAGDAWATHGEATVGGRDHDRHCDAASIAAPSFA